VLDHVERPQLARAADGAAAAVRLVAVLERGAVHPRLELLFGPPARVDEVDVTAVGRSHELERLEAGGLRDLTGPGGEPALELLDPVGRDGDGVDADDAHVALSISSPGKRRRHGGCPSRPIL
jgi:hypothetical protein